MELYDFDSNHSAFSMVNYISNSQRSVNENLKEVIGVGEAKRVLEWKHTKQFLVPDIKIMELINGVIGSSGFDIKKNNLFYSSYQFGEDMMAKILVEEKYFSFKKTTYFNKVVSLIRPGDHIYGHWLVDILPRLWLLKEKLETVSDVTIILRWNVPSFAVNMIKLLGYKEENIYFKNKDEKILSKISYIVSNFRYNQVFHTHYHKYANHLKKVLEDKIKNEGLIGARSYEKIFLSRKNWRGKGGKKLRSLLNINEVESYLKINGYQVIYPENYTLEEQYLLYSNISTVIAEDGSALHNTIFMGDKVNICCLRSETNMSLIQGALCNVNKQKITYLLGSNVDEGMERMSNYTIDINYLTEFLENNRNK
ncbi:glycosyltransferase family 61 protein [Pseudoalteromonas agarivorans]|uniref:Glycosyltransferase family 61 protein n=1 Tax=Pseudoalteromonas agarivorans TaxID=176102 RepID=A0AAD0TWF3_9GAMM|nr:glycosyltransferase 61 family protein [Pseudoalteromonas agarivorans]AYM85578.1 glycosyltransferase family 61 protein [Pseudoalteromonas agarivorans]